MGRNDFKLSCKLSSRSLIVFTKNCNIILFSCLKPTVTVKAITQICSVKVDMENDRILLFLFILHLCLLLVTAKLQYPGLNMYFCITLKESKVQKNRLSRNTFQIA